MSNQPQRARSVSPTRQPASPSPDVQDRLQHASLLTEPGPGDTSPAPQSDVASLRRLLDTVEESGTAFQSVAVAAVQIIERALCFEREATKAALSLGQQQKLQSMVDTASRASELLRSALQAQGAKVMHLCTGTPAPDVRDGQSWWNALSDALRVLEEGTGRMTSLTTAQPEGSPAYNLSRLIAQLLRDHHDALVLEAEQWMG